MGLSATTHTAALIGCLVLYVELRLRVSDGSEAVRAQPPAPTPATVVASETAGAREAAAGASERVAAMPKLPPPVTPTPPITPVPMTEAPKTPPPVPYQDSELAVALVAQAEQRWPSPKQRELDAGEDWVINEKDVLLEQDRHNWTRLLDCCCNIDPGVNDFVRSYLYMRRQQHYGLLANLGRRIAEQGGGLLCEFGAQNGASAMSLGNDARNTLYSFDIDDVEGRVRKVLNAHRPGVRLSDAAPNWHFVQGNILDRTSKENRRHRRMILGARLILLDTAHFPETVPFEYEFVQMLISRGYSGLLIVDDIRFNKEMNRFWNWVTTKFDKDRTRDIGRMAHFTGTGVVNFGGSLRVDLIQEQLRFPEDVRGPTFGVPIPQQPRAPRKRERIKIRASMPLESAR